MSKSLKRVRAALIAAGLPDTIRETVLARTAGDAAQALGCDIDQIAKSIIFRGAQTGRIILFITAGGQRVDPARASALANEPLEKADAGQIRTVTGFAIGGVAPIGHLTPPLGFFDKKLIEFDTVWAAAGTPNHVFSIEPADLLNYSATQLSDFT
ncbi:MAG: YbaK/EbsC family protein [Sulfitobacter sp.]